MAESFVPRIIRHLSDLLEGGGAVGVNLNVRKELKNILLKLKEIQNMLNDAETRKLAGDDDVAVWLKKVEDISYEIEDVVLLGDRKFNNVNNVNTKQVRSNFILPSLASCLSQVVAGKKKGFASKIQEINGKLESTLKEADQFNFVTISTTDNHRRGHVDSENSMFYYSTVAPYVGESVLYGRSADRNSLLECLLDDDTQENKVISIVGLAGSGKTTLASVLYHHREVEKKFDFRRWVSISNTFDERCIARAIFRSSDEDNDESESDPELSSLVFRLMKLFLSERRVLLVLDDVWIEERSKWIPFFNAIKHAALGSVILVTTRSDKVAREASSDYKHSLAPLSDSDCWLILKDEAGNDDISKIGWKLARKCQGLPLVAKVFGSMILHDDQDPLWFKNLLDTEVWLLEEVGREIFRHFCSSYEYFSPQLKQCISYCAVFPKNSVINVDQLMRLWMARGYIDPDLDMKTSGIEYFNYLADHSFFQELVKGSIHKNKVTSCKMHDSFHDFAQYMAHHGHTEFGSDDQIDNSHSLILFSDPQLVHDPQVLFRRMKYHVIKALVLSSCHLEQLPSEVGDLIHLQYLDLSGNPLKQLPETICNLHSLEFLDVHFCYLLSGLPEQIENLYVLEHLRINHTTDKLHDHLPQGFEELIFIRTLDVFRAGGKYNDALKKLRKLDNLEEIRIAVHGEVNFGDAELESKTHMENLELCFVGEGRDQEKVRNSIEDLKPPPNLQMLKLEDYPGLHLPKWIFAESIINMLRRLSLRSAVNIQSLTALWKLSSLEFLWLYDLPNLKHLGREFFGLPRRLPVEKGNQKTWTYLSEDDDDQETTTTFRSLKTLRIEYLANWETWEDLDESDDKRSNQISVMPSLEELIIAGCPKLRELPDQILGKIPSLKEVVGKPTVDKSC